MQKITLTIRVDLEDKERWEREARKTHSGLSAWIRERLNEAVGPRKAVMEPEAEEEKEFHERRRYESED